MDRYIQNRRSFEGGTLGTFKATVLNLMERGGWQVWTYHRNSDVISGSSGTITSIAQIRNFVDSLYLLGEVRVVTPSVGYDFHYRSEIASPASRVSKNFRPQWSASDSLPPYCVKGDQTVWAHVGSTYTNATGGNIDTGSDNHGFGDGEGYVIWDWATLGDGDDMLGSGGAVWMKKNFFYTIPNESDGTDYLTVEFWVTVNENIYDVVLGDSIGVSFFGYNVADDENTFNGGFAYEELLSDVTQNRAWWSVRKNDTTLGSQYTFSGDEELGNGPHWMQVRQRWRVPSGPDVIDVNFWKGARIPAGAVRMSNLKVKWFNSKGRRY